MKGRVFCIRGTWPAEVRLAARSHVRLPAQGCLPDLILPGHWVSNGAGGHIQPTDILHTTHHLYIPIELPYVYKFSRHIEYVT